MLLIKH